MAALRPGMVLLIAAQPLVLAVAILWPPTRHPGYLREAYRARQLPPAEQDLALVRAA